MEANQGKETGPVNPELQKHIRFQQAGWLTLCAWPVATIAAAMCNVSVMRIILMSVLMIGVAILIFAIGYTGQQELKQRDDESTK